MKAHAWFFALCSGLPLSCAQAVGPTGPSTTPVPNMIISSPASLIPSNGSTPAPSPGSSPAASVGLPAGLGASSPVPLSRLLPGQVAPALYPNLPTQQLGGPLGLTLGVQGIDTAGNGKVGAVLLLAGKWQLSANEINILTQLVGNLATQCFNISPERLVNISDWLIRQNNRLSSTPQKSRFGPLEVTYRPWQYTTAQRLSSVVLSRSGVPGQEPWTNSCLL